MSIKERQKRSAIWFCSKTKLTKIVKAATTLTAIAVTFGMTAKGGNFATIKRCLDANEIDYSHITLGLNSNKGRNFNKPSIPLSEVMVEHSTYSRRQLKKRLIKNGLLENKCNECGQPPEWNGKILILVLDHKNGTSDDHRFDNLQLLCPNCNSQTETFCGRRRKY